MSTEIAIRPDFNTEEIALIRQQAGADKLNEAEFKVFLHMCRERALDPLQKELIPIVFSGEKTGRRVSYVTPIEVMLAKAAESGQFGGVRNQRLFVERGNEKLLVPHEQLLPTDGLISASVDVYRLDCDGPFTGTALFKNFSKDTTTWRQFPDLMLMKCALGQGLRLAFPKRLGKLYAPEEMEQPPITVTAEIVDKPKRGRPPKAEQQIVEAPNALDRVDQGRIKIDEIIASLGIEREDLVRGAHNVLAEMVSGDSPVAWLDLSVEQLIAAYRASKSAEFHKRLREEGIPFNE